MKEVVVLGAGVIGLNIALQCARRGHRVTVLDRSPEKRSSCSFGNAGMIVPSHFVPLAAPGMIGQALRWMINPRSPFYIKPRLDIHLLKWGLRFCRSANTAHVTRSAPVLRDMSLASRALFEKLSDELRFNLVRRGLLMLCKSQYTLDEEARLAETARALGISAEVLSPAETAALEPNLRMDIAGAVYFPQDCHLSPSDFMGSLKAELDRADVNFEWETEITGFRRAGNRIVAVYTEKQSYVADQFVLACGAWTPNVAQWLGLDLPMQAGKGYALTLTQPRQLPQMCAICTEARVAVTPMNGSLRFAGTLEISGLNDRINPARVQGIIDSVPKYFPDFTPSDFAGVEPWAGLRPCSPDGLPFIGRTSRAENLVVATGHGMLGVSLGPITGELAAQLICKERPAIDLTLLSPDRFS